ncbi:MAG: helix-turn-helix domain-containing protein [Lishizhenia sp.]
MGKYLIVILYWFVLILPIKSFCSESLKTNKTDEPFDKLGLIKDSIYNLKSELKADYIFKQLHKLDEVNDYEGLWDLSNYAKPFLYHRNYWYKAYECSLHELDAAIKLNDSNKINDSKLSVASFLLSIGEIDQSISLTKQLLEENKYQNEYVITKLKIAQLMALGKTEETIALLSNLLNHTDFNTRLSRYIFVLINLCYAYLSADDYQQAMHYLRIAESQKPFQNKVKQHYLKINIEQIKCSIYAGLKMNEAFYSSLEYLQEDTSGLVYPYEISFYKSLKKFHETANFKLFYKAYTKVLVELERLGDYHYYMILSFYMLNLAERINETAYIPLIQENIDVVRQRNRNIFSQMNITLEDVAPNTKQKVHTEKSTNVSTPLMLIALSMFLVFLIFYAKKTNKNGKHKTKIHHFSSEDLVKINQLEKLLENKKILYRENLTLTEISKLLNTNSTTLSNLINQNYKKPFPQLVNEMRIQDICEMIAKGENKKYSIEAMSQIVGYKSKSTFYKNFKKIHGITPAEYITKVNNINK